jgi:hypothetical protein
MEMLREKALNASCEGRSCRKRKDCLWSFFLGVAEICNNCHIYCGELFWVE